MRRHPGVVLDWFMEAYVQTMTRIVEGRSACVCWESAFNAKASPELVKN